MDRSLLEKKQRKKIKALKKKLAKQEAISRTKPEKTEDLDDVVKSEIEKMKINKEPAGPPVQIKEEEPAAEEEESTSEEDKVAEPASDDVVTSTEVLDATKEAVADDKKKKPSRRAGGGDFGAAYQELYVQLCTRMLTRIYRYFQKLYNKSKSEEEFRKKLAGIQNWNKLDINRRAKEIVEQYPDTEVYFRYAYAANTMLMSVVVQKDENSEEIEVEVPKFSDFIQKCYLESARILYDNVGVLNPDLPDKDRLAIRTELYSAYGNAVATALRMMVPLETIAPKMENRERFDDVADSSEGEEESESESESEEDSEDDSDEDGSEEDDSDEDSEDDSDDEDDSEEDSDEDTETGFQKLKSVPISKKTLQEEDSNPFE